VADARTRGTSGSTSLPLVLLVLALMPLLLLGGCTGAAKKGDSPTAEAGASRQSGIDEYNDGDFAGAELTLAAVVAENPDDAEARKTLALALAAQGKNVEAIEQYSKVVEAQPDDHVTLYRLALLERLAGKPNDALAHLQKAIELQQDDSYIDELARTYLQLGEYRKAADAWGTLVATEGRTPESTVGLLKLQAEALDLAGDADGAKAAVQRALEISPDDPDLQARLEALEE
jgi:tetratricopeptide (TPR) repeat protein